MKRTTTKLFIALTVSIFFLTSGSFCQNFFYNDNLYEKDLIFEVGTSAGIMVGATDVGRKKFSAFLPNNYDIKSFKLNSSFYLGFLYKDLVGARVEFSNGNVAGADSNSNNEYYKLRDLSYRSSISEVSLIGEFYPIMLKRHENLPRFSPYMMAGIGYFSYNPQALYMGRWVDLRPLRTEGQGFSEFPNRSEYRLNAFCLPVGIGLKYEFSSLLSFRIEALQRYTTTDYLDDASTTFINASLFEEYLQPKQAAIAADLAHRYKEKNPEKTLVNTRGTPGNDKYITVNLKVELTFGRQRR